MEIELIWKWVDELFVDQSSSGDIFPVEILMILSVNELKHWGIHILKLWHTFQEPIVIFIYYIH